MPASLISDRFEQLYIPEPNSGCWLWLGYLDPKSGYGYFHWTGTKSHTVKAHVAAYRLFKGNPNTLHVCHQCDMRCCVNPNHLFLGTAKANAEDRVSKNRSGRLPGEKHPRATLTTEIVQAIRLDDRPRSVIASHYGIYTSTVYKIKRRLAWKHLP